MGDLENINTLSKLIPTFKYICSGGLIHPGNSTFYINALERIKDFWFRINDRCNRNQSRTGGKFNQVQRDEFHDIYRDVQERAEEKHEKKWIFPKW